MHAWHAVVLGLVEGITEYLPVSSTGHLILASSLMHLDRTVSKKDLDDFEIVIQGGAILAVLGLYWPSVLKMLKGLLGKDPQGFALFVNLVLAFIPSAVIGLALNHFLEKHLFLPGPVLLSLFLGGVYMLLVDGWQKGKIARVPSSLPDKSIYDVTPRDAVKIGLMQCLALWPGTSRSLMTITGGLFSGLRPKQAAEFSFLLGLPTLTAATLYKLYKNLDESHKLGTPNMFQALGATACVIGIGVAAISAAIAVRWLVTFLTKHGLSPFGWYRIVLTFVMGGLVLAGIVQIGDSGPVRNDSTQKLADPIQWNKPGTTPASPSVPASGGGVK
ncbi:MAG: undecaprenyl-diphosphate phosphatase [Tepidisphaera sp.]|nr:undecaprenyl-diphosphate phosphatase [Tepidisphaera sp.]